MPWAVCPLHPWSARRRSHFEPAAGLRSGRNPVPDGRRPGVCTSPDRDRLPRAASLGRLEWRGRGRGAPAGRRRLDRVRGGSAIAFSHLPSRRLRGPVTGPGAAEPGRARRVGPGPRRRPAAAGRAGPDGCCQSSRGVTARHAAAGWRVGSGTRFGPAGEAGRTGGDSAPEPALEARAGPRSGRPAATHGVGVQRDPPAGRLEGRKWNPIRPRTGAGGPPRAPGPAEPDGGPDPARRATAVRVATRTARADAGECGSIAELQAITDLTLK